MAARRSIPIRDLKRWIFDAVVDLLAAIWAKSLAIVGPVYIYGWVKRTRFRHALDRAALVYLSGSLLLLLTEVVLESTGVTVLEHSWLAQLVFFGAILIALYVKYREWRDREQEFYFIEGAKDVVNVLAPAAGGSLEDGVYDLLKIFRATFQRRGDVNANVAFREAEKIRVRYVYPVTAHYDDELVLEPGEGAAGFACEHQTLVYVPWKRIRHGVVQRIMDSGPSRVEPEVYVPSRIEEFQTVLSVPLLAYGKCFGALSLDCNRVNAFRRIDFAQAIFFGFVMAQFLQRRGVAGHDFVTGLTDANDA